MHGPCNGSTARRGVSTAALVASVVALASTFAMAQVQVSGTPGSPNAAVSVEGNQLPAPTPKFEGVIRESVTDSKPWWPPRVVPPNGAPNILLIMTDDQGYGVPSTAASSRRRHWIGSPKLGCATLK